MANFRFYSKENCTQNTQKLATSSQSLTWSIKTAYLFGSNGRFKPVSSQFWMMSRNWCGPVARLARRLKCPAKAPKVWSTSSCECPLRSIRKRAPRRMPAKGRDIAKPSSDTDTHQKTFPKLIRASVIRIPWTLCGLRMSFTRKNIRLKCWKVVCGYLSLCLCIPVCARTCYPLHFHFVTVSYINLHSINTKFATTVCCCLLLIFFVC